MFSKKLPLRKILLIALIAGGFTLAIAVSNAQALLSRLSAPLAITDPYLSHEIVISDLDTKEYLPSVAFNWKHNEYLVVWHTTWNIGSSDIRAARISVNGEILSEFTVHEHATRDSIQPAVDYDPVNDRYLVVWVHDVFGDGSDWDLYGRILPWEGPSASLLAFPISTFGTHQWIPKVAYGRAVEEFLVVWNNEYQDGSLPMYISGRRIKAADGTFPGNDSDLTIYHTSEQRINPDVTYNLARNEYLVVYDNVSDIFGTRYTGSINYDFGGEFGIAAWPDAESHPAAAACNAANQYLVAWQSNQGGTNEAIYARFIAGDGTVGNVYQIDDTTGSEIEADVACNQAGQRYLVAWQTEYAAAPYGIWGRFVHSNETMEPQFPVVDPTQTASRTQPIVAGGHTNYLVVWEHQRTGTAFQDIHGRLITSHIVFIPLVQRDLP